MHKIYFGYSCLAICHPEEIRQDSGTRVKNVRLPEEVKALVDSFKSGKEEGTVFVTGDDTGWILDSVRGEFKEVNAAGGLVKDGNGHCLVIKRNALWDLPKGHQEEGEDIKVTALREVEEETGITGLELGGLICITDHCYIRDGIWHMKHTWWYDMSSRDSSAPVPQTEEDISEAIWVPESIVQELVMTTFPSIIEVFSIAFAEQ